MTNKEIILNQIDFKSFYAIELPKIKWNGNRQGIALCPFHNDTKESLSVNSESGVFFCHACNEKGDIFSFYQKRHSVDFQTALHELGEKVGISADAKKKIVKTYGYTNAEGNLIFQCVRYEPKSFAQRRPDGKNGWIWNLDGITPVLYCLPELVKAKADEFVFIPEGEKDCNNLRTLGLAATTNPMGAGKWKEEYSQYLKGKNVVILSDNDQPGKNHALQVAKSLRGVAKSIRVVELQGLPEKGDVSDWLDLRDAKEPEVLKAELLGIAENTPEWQPSQSQAAQTGMPLIKLGDLLREPEEDISYLIDGVLPSGGFSVLASKPKTGKSTLARNLALNTAKGNLFLNRNVTKGSVIYYALEEKKSEVKKHFQDMGATEEDEIYIYTGSVPVDALMQIRKIVESIKPALVIIDPLFRLARVKDGNDYVQVTQALDPLLRLARDTGTHVLCVHHTNKGQGQGGDSVLGSTAIFSSVDTLLIMKRHEDYRTIQSIQRYGEDLPETTLHFDKDSRTIEIGKPKQEEDIEFLKKAITEFLSSQSEPVIKSVIMEEVEGRAILKRKALMELVERGPITREGEGGKGNPFKYSMSLCPSIYRDIAKQNVENAENPCKQKANGVSQPFAENQEDEKSRDIAFSGNFDLKEGVI